MNYKNGNCYEGQWYKNKKQGFGILRTGVRAVYEGSFTNHVRDGEGTQAYDNGDRFEGFWLMDMRHGHGELLCADGSHYVGNFLNDMFNGEGRMTHASGVVYQGQWKDGYPVIMATKLHIIVEEQPLVIRQNLPFSVRVECHDDEGNIIPDMGRELQVMAGFKYKVPKEGSALFDVIEDVADKPIPTPFYDVVPYPITDQVSMAGIELPEDGAESKLTDVEVPSRAEMLKVEDKGDEEGEEDAGADDPPAAEAAPPPPSAPAREEAPPTAGGTGAQDSGGSLPASPAPPEAADT